jgi:hypothetical protein
MDTSVKSFMLDKDGHPIEITEPTSGTLSSVSSPRKLVITGDNTQYFAKYGVRAVLSNIQAAAQRAGCEAEDLELTCVERVVKPGRSGWDLNATKPVKWDFKMKTPCPTVPVLLPTTYVGDNWYRITSTADVSSEESTWYFSVNHEGNV